MNQKNRSWIIWVGGIALLLCWGYGMSKQLPRPNPQPVALSSQPGQVENAGLHLGPNLVSISTTWSIKLFADDATWMHDGHAVAKNVSWQVRYDGDDSKVYTFPPINSPGNYNFNYTNQWTYKEIRIAPDQTTTQCEYTFILSPRPNAGQVMH
jgi:hypothetical protein